jgi:hypothetical protein
LLVYQLHQYVVEVTGIEEGVEDSYLGVYGSSVLISVHHYPHSKKCKNFETFTIVGWLVAT